MKDDKAQFVKSLGGRVREHGDVFKGTSAELKEKLLKRHNATAARDDGGAVGAVESLGAQPAASAPRTHGRQQTQGLLAQYGPAMDRYRREHDPDHSRPPG